MLDRRKLLHKLIEGIGVREEDSVTVREAYWGYIIHSTKPSNQQAFQGILIRLVSAAAWIAVIGVWLAPTHLFPEPFLLWKLGFSLLLLGFTYAVMAVCRPPAGYEFQVDINKRQIRTAILDSKGQRRGLIDTAFGDITDPVLTRSRDGSSHPSLALRVRGKDGLLPVAIGQEKTLMAVYDRLMRDLRPIEDRVVGVRVQPALRTSPRGHVFPRLGPEEIAA